MSSADSSTIAVLLGILGTFWFIILALVVLQIISQWKLFTKAGRPGWASIIPIYNQYVLFEIVGLKGWYVFLGFIPFVGAFIVMIFNYMAYYKLAICFGKNSGFGIGMIFLPFIFGLILAFSDATYTKPNPTN